MEPWLLHSADRMSFVRGMAFTAEYGPLPRYPIGVFDLADGVWWAKLGFGDELQPIAGQTDRNGFHFSNDREMEPFIYDVYVSSRGDVFALLDREVWRTPPGTKLPHRHHFSFAEGVTLPEIPDDKKEFLTTLHMVSSGLNAVEKNPELPPWQWRQRAHEILGPAAQLMQPAENPGVAEMLQRGAFLTFKHPQAPAPHVISRVGSDVGVVFGAKGTKLLSLEGLDLHRSWSEVEQQLAEAIRVPAPGPYELSVLVADGVGGHLSLGYPANLDGQFQWKHVKDGHSSESDLTSDPGPSVNDAVMTAAWLASRSWSAGSPEPDWGAAPGQTFAQTAPIADAIARADGIPVRRTALGIRSVGSVQRQVRGSARK